MSKQSIIYTVISFMMIFALLALLLITKIDENKALQKVVQKDLIIQKLNKKSNGFDAEILEKDSFIHTLLRQLDSLQRDSLFKEIAMDEVEIDEYEAEIKRDKKSSKKKTASRTAKRKTTKNSKVIRFKSQQFDTYLVDLRKFNLTFHHKDKKGKRLQTFGNLKKEYIRNGEKLRFATNGGIFKPNQDPEGLYVEKGIVIADVNLKKGAGNFYMKPNGIFYINDWNKVGIIQSTDYSNIKGKIEYATQSGPLLLLNNKMHKAFPKNSQNKKLRSGVGIIDSHTAVFIISQKPVNFYDFAMLFKEEFNCKSALYLDGVISQMYLPELNRHDTKGVFSILIGVSETN